MDRRTLILATCFALAPLGSRTAEATCGGNCDIRSTLAGWSKDGSTWVTIEKYDPYPVEVGDNEVEMPVHVLVVWKNGVRVEQYAKFPGEAGADIFDHGLKIKPLRYRNTRWRSAAQRVNVAKFKPLRKYKLIRLKRAWRVEFKNRVTISRGKRRVFEKHRDDDPDGCTSWTLTASSKVVAHIVRACEGALVFGSVAGGYVSPDGRSALVKILFKGEGFTSWVEFRRIELPEP